MQLLVSLLNKTFNLTWMTFKQQQNKLSKLLDHILMKLETI